MVSLTEVLRNENKEILNILNELRSKGISSNDSRKRFYDLRGILLEHIRKEEKEFYPVLSKASKDDFDMNEMIMRSDVQMRLLSMQSYDFFQKYDIDPDNDDFMQDISRLISMIMERVKIEEEILYPRFDGLYGRPEDNNVLPKPPMVQSF